jgi:hypothetical protein
VDVGQDTAVGDGDVAEQLVELLVVADSQLNVTGHNSGLLVVTGGVTGQLQDLSSQVLHDSGKVHGGTTTNASSVSALLQEAAHTAHRELQTGLGRARRALLATSGLTTTTLTTLSTSNFTRHIELVVNDSYEKL